MQSYVLLSYVHIQYKQWININSVYKLPVSALMKHMTALQLYKKETVFRVGLFKFILW